MLRKFTVRYFNMWYEPLLAYLGSHAAIFRNTKAGKKNMCMICNLKKAEKVYPIFEVNHESKEIILKRLVKICPMCNQALYVSSYSHEREATAEYLSGILKCSVNDCLSEMDAAYAEYVQTIKYQFNFDALRFSIELKSRRL